MSVDQLEEGVMQLWRDTWNSDAFTRRKRYYRELLRARQAHAGQPPLDEVEEFYAIPVGA